MLFGSKMDAIYIFLNLIIYFLIPLKHAQMIGLILKFNKWNPVFFNLVFDAKNK